eukprot:Phypoly_transcript_14330.p1 GENE.Phypoly_transcript_14330~~Phypoly_transcript_14330.p1  ORF type:complete len:104 (+),score=1.99 Phypoly_transcript_14330:30-314(+)
MGSQYTDKWGHLVACVFLPLWMQSFSVTRKSSPIRTPQRSCWYNTKNTSSGPHGYLEMLQGDIYGPALNEQYTRNCGLGFVALLFDIFVFCYPL